MSRKKRAGEVVCGCGAYPFPHRMMGGACNGGAFVDRVWESHQCDKCQACVLFDTAQTDDGIQFVCQVLSGQEPYTACPELEEKIQFDGIKLYGVNRREK